MKIDFNEKEINFTFPRFQNRFNPYDEDGEYGLYPTFTGLVVRHGANGNHWDEIGFAGTIDMSYKGKPDQVSDIIVAWDGDEDSFIKMCEKLSIGWQILEI
jgi:hypothetical protein